MNLAHRAPWIVPLVLASCGPLPPPPDTARMPLSAYPVYADADVGSINQAQWAFADASRTRGNPVDAARAVAAVDYLAGQLSTSPRWAFMSPLTKLEMLQARQDVRAAIGIAPGASSQEVVDRLEYAANALASDHAEAATTAFQPPVFTLPPQQTLAVLTDMPFLRRVNIATSHAGAQVFPDGGGSRFDN